MAFTNPTAKTLIDGAWVTSTGAAPTQVNEALLSATIGNPAATTPVDFNVAFKLSTNATFEANIANIPGWTAGFATAAQATQFLNNLSTNLSGTPVEIPAELNGFVNWLLATPGAGSSATVPNGWAGIASVFIEALLGNIPVTDLVAAGLTADEISFFGNQHTAAVNRSFIGGSYAAALAANPNLSQDAWNKLILQGVDQTQATVNNAQAQLASGTITGQAQTFFLTTGLDVPPAYQTSSDNAVFSSSDVILSGIVAQTLNPGDHLVSTGQNATLDLSASTQSTSVHNYAGFTTDGVPNLSIHNSDSFGISLDGSQMHGLTDITSTNAVLGGFITLNAIPNQVALHVRGAVDFLTLNYANPVTQTQVLELTNAVEHAVFDEITFGTNAPTAIAVSLTGSSTVHIDDAVLTSISATTTDAGGTNHLTIEDEEHNTLLNADFSAVKGALTVTFEDDALANGANIRLGSTGATDSTNLTIGQSNNIGHTNDSVSVSGVGGHYNITLGNQNDFITLGGHGTGDTLTFMQPYVATNNLDTIFNPNLGTDQYNFSVSGFNGGSNPAANFTTALLAAGNAGTTFATTVAAGQTAVAGIWDGASLLNGTGLAGLGTNVIVDTNPLTASALGVDGQLFLNPIKASVGFAFGQFLIAYQATDGVHIATDTLTGGGFLDSTNVHDIIDLVGQSISSLSTPTQVANLIHFTA